MSSRLDWRENCEVGWLVENLGFVRFVSKFVILYWHGWLAGWLVGGSGLDLSTKREKKEACSVI